MGRRKKKKQTLKQKVILIERQSKEKGQLWLTLLGLALTIITGVAIPFYFQYQANQSQQSTINALATIQAQQAVPIFATRASGTLVFYNGLVTPRVVPTGTMIIASNGIEVTTVETVIIPGGNPPYYGYANVPAQAIQPGYIGNIPVRTIDQTCCAFDDSLRVQNITPFTGGGVWNTAGTQVPSNS